MKITLELDPAEVNTILEALGELPAKRVVPLMAKIHQSAQEQKAPAEVETPSA